MESGLSRFFRWIAPMAPTIGVRADIVKCDAPDAAVLVATSPRPSRMGRLPDTPSMVGYRMAGYGDELRLLHWIAEHGGWAATVNVAGRGGEIGVDSDEIADLVDALISRGILELLEDGDVRLTPSGRALAELPDL